MAPRARSTDPAAATAGSSSSCITNSRSAARFTPVTSTISSRPRIARRAASVQLPPGRSVKIARMPPRSMRSRSSASMSSPPSPVLLRGSSRLPRPVIRSTADRRPAESSPWPATSARAASGVPLLIVLHQVLAHVGLATHLRDQSIVEPFRRIDAAVAQQQVERDHLGEHGDVLARVERHADLRDLDLEDRGALEVEPRALDDRLGIPLLELDDDLDPLLLAHRLDAEDPRHVDEPDAADLHVVALQLVAAGDEDVVSAALHDHDVVGDETMAALDEVEHALGLADPALAHEQQPDAEDVGERAVKRRLRRELLLEPGLEPPVELVRLERRAEDGDAGALGGGGETRRQLLRLRHEDDGHREGEEGVDDAMALGLGPRREVADLGLAEHLHAVRHE